MHIKEKLISSNKKAKYDYFLSNTLECGLELFGPEVKSIIKNGISLKESYVKIINNEVFLINSNISIEFKHTWDKREMGTRAIRLLLHKRQIKKFQNLLKENGTTLICTKVYHKGLLKCEVALGKGKKEYDKRETIKARDLNRINNKEVM